ncbi:HD domain-containing protein [Paenisporosarcina cavernae]|uniref:HD domain-containing protein n=1 Tax=Paenisporosarcina cavernae TaxID=2320858 RepID=A0A385YUS2_9BACL|nr:HD domain-containing protein [Paenisporosarcina cavernae]AYC29438.1 HD domain-containing protein [Paenisporosarcina cavernae]
MNEKIIHFVQTRYEQFDASHDWQHIERVLENAARICETEENVREDIINYAILLHDVDDPKYKKEFEKSYIDEALSFLVIPKEEKDWIKEIIHSTSFNGGNQHDATTLEAKIVRDADRLDAIGAIGIARTFAYGGAKGRKLYDWNEMVREEMTEEEYRSTTTSSVTHFYEKLFLLKELMVTTEGKRLAQERHEFMELFIHQLQNETRARK